MSAKFSPETPAAIGKYAVLYGSKTAIHYFSNEDRQEIKDSSISM